MFFSNVRRGFSSGSELILVVFLFCYIECETKKLWLGVLKTSPETASLHIVHAVSYTCRGPEFKGKFYHEAYLVCSFIRYSKVTPEGTQYGVYFSCSFHKCEINMRMWCLRTIVCRDILLTWLFLVAFTNQSLNLRQYIWFLNLRMLEVR